MQEKILTCPLAMVLLHRQQRTKLMTDLIDVKNDHKNLLFPVLCVIDRSK